MFCFPHIKSSVLGYFWSEPVGIWQQGSSGTNANSSWILKQCAMQFYAQAYSWIIQGNWKAPVGWLPAIALLTSFSARHALSQLSKLCPTGIVGIIDFALEWNLSFELICVSAFERIRRWKVMGGGWKRTSPAGGWVGGGNSLRCFALFS